eukprot:TRINITY_DN3301_c0_g1_i1.p1 TRINITY_DN3301_c0_g1~~TRINITY_DN3301_c0_g1_i1.p1  ORF type:complete len:519 (+),score=111.26 TRINITY_DN3301_c0_g1_i1:20-1576(+)
MKLFILLLIVSVAYCEVINFSYGGRNNKLFVPKGDEGKAIPLFVMLHGCTQNPDDFMKGTQMNQQGEKRNFLVLYPEQPSSANSNKCWNWFETAHQKRGSGEPKLIVDMVNAVKAKYNVDEGRVFASGLSAGAAMSVILGSTYPDVFACIGAGSGLEYKAATSMISAFTAMSSGGPSPETQGKLAYSASSSINKEICVSVFHGTSDYTVSYINGQQITQQFAVTNDLNFNKGTQKGSIVETQKTSGTVPGGLSYVRAQYDNTVENRPVIEFVTVDKMGHAWSGGSTAGSYTDPKGPDASEMMTNFFLNYTDTNPTSASTSNTPTTNTGSTTSSETSSDTTTTDGEKKIDLPSISGEDGFVGQTILDSYGTGTCKLGDKGMFNVDTYRTILSFPTFEIPEDATIKRATLTITRTQLSGNVGYISVDMKTGSFNSAGDGLARSDYSASASVTDAFTLDIPSSNGQSVTMDLPSYSLEYINRKTGKNERTQLRLKGSTTASFTANTLFISCGGAVLTVYYE